jgi:hypothetical protein
VAIPPEWGMTTPIFFGQPREMIGLFRETASSQPHLTKNDLNFYVDYNLTLKNNRKLLVDNDSKEQFYQSLMDKYKIDKYRMAFVIIKFEVGILIRTDKLSKENVMIYYNAEFVLPKKDEIKLIDECIEKIN